MNCYDKNSFIIHRKAVALLAQKETAPKVIHTTQTFHFTPRPETDCHNDLGIADQEFFTDAFIKQVTNDQFESITALLANRWQSLDQIIQATTAFADFESFKLAAFADYLQQHSE